MADNRKGTTFVRRRFNKQMTDYYPAANTLVKIVEQDEGDRTGEEPEEEERQEEEEKQNEGESRQDKEGTHGKDRIKKDNKTETQRAQKGTQMKKHYINDWPSSPTYTAYFPTLNGGLRIAAFRHERVSIKRSETHGWGLFLDTSPGVWEVNQREHLQRSRRPQHFDPGPLCRYHGPRYKTATLITVVMDNNDYI